MLLVSTVSTNILKVYTKYDAGFNIILILNYLKDLCVASDRAVEVATYRSKVIYI